MPNGPEAIAGGKGSLQVFFKPRSPQAPLVSILAIGNGGRGAGQDGGNVRNDFEHAAHPAFPLACPRQMPRWLRMANAAPIPLVRRSSPRGGCR